MESHRVIVERYPTPHNPPGEETFLLKICASFPIVENSKDHSESFLDLVISDDILSKDIRDIHN